nr:acyltransferase family protein [Aquabacter cavernae]
MKYRSDISGLRALAVLPVVLFHFNEQWLPGGFVGVDIFFVISGYLITSILAADLREGRFSLLRFYDRRLRRIVPAFAAVALVTALISLFILPPGLLEDFGASLRSASIFFANRYFLSVTHYFGAAPDELFLLHTWSLSVEEQFYLGWPLLLAVLFHPKLRRFLPYILVVLMLVSLYVATRNAVLRPVAGFYNSNGRFWELLLGAFLALGYLPRLRSARVAEGVAGLGLVLILVSLALFDPKKILFPGVSALVPTLGALFILWAGEEGRTTLVGRLLSFGPVAGIGLISYSLYLWHWPVIAIHRYLTFRAPGPLECVLLFAVMVAVSAFSWRFIEAPFRRSGPSTTRGEWVSVGVGVGALAVLVAIGTLFTATGGLPGRASASFLKTEAIVNTFWKGREACLIGRTKDRETACRFGDPRPDAPYFIMWGDSQGDQHGPALDAVAQKMGMGFLQFSRAGCAPQAPDPEGSGWQSNAVQQCNASRAEAIRRIVEDPKVAFAVISGRWTNETSLDVAMARLATAVEAITAAGKPVLLVAPPGTFPNGGGRCLVRRAFMGADDSMCGTTRAASDAEGRATEQALEALAKGHKDVAVFMPRALFCDEQSCHPRTGDVPLYYDGGHLNVEGSLFLSRALEEALGALRKATP